MSITSFSQARAIWPIGRSKLMNDYVLFRAAFFVQDGGNQSYTLKITGSTLYRIKIDGTFLGFGPARAAKGYFRIDELPLVVAPGRHILEIEVSGCNVNSYFYLDQPSFLQAEILDKDQACICYTGRDFHAFELGHERLRKVPRYSLQRMFMEIYRLSPQRESLQELPLEMQEDRKYLKRDFPLPRYELDTSYRPIRKLRLTRRKPPQFTPEERFLEPLPDEGFKCYDFASLDFNAYNFLKEFAHDEQGTIPATLFEGKINNSGFINLTVNCTHPGYLVLTFTENCPDRNGIEPFGNEAINAIIWYLNAPGTYHLESLEPYTFKFAEAYMDGAAGEVVNLSLREYKSPLGWDYPFATADQEYQAIFAAGRETFAANAVDGFTDCPSRERAAWLCDSFFTARTAFMLTGNAELERPFLENFALAEDFSPLPDGAIPMLYPGDHPNKLFIPNWPLWLILQVEDYWHRSKDEKLIAALREKLLGYIRYLDSFLNSDGLLENLPSWVFVEWSKANDFVQTVNYPSNMLFAAALETLSRLYCLPEYQLRAQKIRQTICLQSWNGQWFCDHAVRTNGVLTIPSDDITETCQYYAFFCHCADQATHPDLWKRLVNDFGPERAKKGKFPEIAPANAFIGNYLRLELLSAAGLHQQVLQEAKGYFGKMAAATGTLWEHDRPLASCCHGFSSYINVLLVRALQALGL